jgi:hypothetical protein
VFGAAVLGVLGNTVCIPTGQQLPSKLQCSAGSSVCDFHPKKHSCNFRAKKSVLRAVSGATVQWWNWQLHSKLHCSAGSYAGKLYILRCTAATLQLNAPCCEPPFVSLHYAGFADTAVLGSSCPTSSFALHKHMGLAPYPYVAVAAFCLSLVTSLPPCRYCIDTVLIHTHTHPCAQAILF